MHLSHGCITETARDIPIAGVFDVVVVGGGIAGVTAALAARRAGASVCLLERYCGLGGLATLGVVTHWLPLCDGRGRQVIPGLGEELLKLSVADLHRDYPRAAFRRVPPCWTDPNGTRETRIAHRYRADFNPSAYLLALEERVDQAGITIFYDTRFCQVRRESTRITHVIIENKDGRTALAASTVIDTTGDADVCLAAGEEVYTSDDNVLCGWFYILAGGKLLLQHLSNRYAIPGTRQAEPPLFAGDAQGITQHLLQSRELIRARLAEYRDRHPDTDAQLIGPPLLPGFRMTRRLVAVYALGQEDMHRWIDDAIGLTGDWRKAGPIYAVPYRSLCAQRNRNLLTAGRTIGTDNELWDVVRAIPTCTVTGEAAGTAAAMAAADWNGDCAALPVSELQAELKAQGVLLDPELVAPAPGDEVTWKPRA